MVTKECRIHGIIEVQKSNCGSFSIFITVKHLGQTDLAEIETITYERKGSPCV